MYVPSSRLQMKSLLRVAADTKLVWSGGTSDRRSENPRPSFSFLVLHQHVLNGVPAWIDLPLPFSSRAPCLSLLLRGSCSA